MKRLVRAVVVTAVIAATTLAPTWASASDFASSSVGSGKTKTYRCGPDRALCEKRYNDYQMNNIVYPIEYRPPSADGRGNYYYFNYTPK